MGINGINSRFDKSKNAVFVYLLFTIGTCFLIGIFAALIPGEAGNSIYRFLATVFTVIPVLAALFTRLILKDRSSLNLSIRVWRNKKALLLCAFLPGAAVLSGAAIYYTVFPMELVPNVQAIFTYCAQYGLPAGLPVNGGSIALAVIILWLVSALAIPLHFFELGEEIGWRGFLLPKMLSFMSVKKAALLNGFLWGLAHAPLIYFGFNYGSGYWGAPVTGIVLMIVFCVCVGICMSYAMIKTNNCMYTAIIHGAINVAADMQIVSVAVNRPLIGPTPAGIIGMSVIVLISAFIFIRKLNNPKRIANIPGV